MDFLSFFFVGSTLLFFFLVYFVSSFFLVRIGLLNIVVTVAGFEELKILFIGAAGITIGFDGLDSNKFLFILFTDSLSRFFSDGCF